MLRKSTSGNTAEQTPRKVAGETEEELDHHRARAVWIPQQRLNRRIQPAE